MSFTGLLFQPAAAQGNRDGDNTIDPGETTSANGASAVAVGTGVQANADYSSAFGVGAMAQNVGSTAIGFEAVADRDYSVSVGSGGSERNIIHVADAVQATDAVNLRQMQAGDAATLVAANLYTDGREQLVRNDVAAGDAETLANANAYTDDREALTPAWSGIRRRSR